MTQPGSANDLCASDLIDQRIAHLADWRGEALQRRELIWQADPKVVEAWKWTGTSVWSHDGITCTGESHKRVVKLTFAKGASLADPTNLFNASLDGSIGRAIDLHEGNEVDVAAFKTLIVAAAALKASTGRTSSKRARGATPLHAQAPACPP